MIVLLLLLSLDSATALASRWVRSSSRWQAPVLLSPYHRKASTLTISTQIGRAREGGGRQDGQPIAEQEESGSAEQDEEHVRGCGLGFLS